MEMFFIYISKVAVCIVLFYFTFRLFLSNETFFSFNRRILLAGTIVCFILPLIQLSLPDSIYAPTPFSAVQEFWAEPDLELFTANTHIETAVNVPLADIQSPKVPINSLIIAILFGAGTLINLVYLLKSVFSIYRLIRNEEVEELDGYKLITVPGNVLPFSWGKYIVVSRTDFGNHREEILAHEMAHIKHRHTWDILLFELLALLQWFNPAMWLLKKELKDVHEYQADRSALQSGIDATRYQLLLVKKAVGSSSYTLANSLYHSKIKKRITMMLKQRSKKYGKLRLIALLPVTLLALYTFAQPQVKFNQSVSQPEKESTAYAFPLKSYTKISAPFGKRNVNGKEFVHNGVDFKATSRDTIFAIAPGTVTISEKDNKRGYGKYVILQHTEGMQSFYAHNSVNLVDANQTVSAGQPIAIVGNTGRSTGPHLHLEVRVNGVPIDPMDLFKEEETIETIEIP